MVKLNAWGGGHERTWHDPEVAALIQLRSEGRSWQYMSRMFRRNKTALQVKYNAAMRAARYEDKRYRALRADKHLQQWRTDLTGIICGDPAPGRSALESYVPPNARRAISLAPVRMGAGA